MSLAFLELSDAQTSRNVDGSVLRPRFFGKAVTASSDHDLFYTAHPSLGLHGHYFFLSDEILYFERAILLQGTVPHERGTGSSSLRTDAKAWLSAVKEERSMIALSLFTLHPKRLSGVLPQHGKKCRAASLTCRANKTFFVKAIFIYSGVSPRPTKSYIESSPQRNRGWRQHLGCQTSRCPKR